MSALPDVHNYAEIRKTGLQALREALGPIGMVRFIQQFASGHGDYTQEKYQQPDSTVEEAVGFLLIPI